MGAAAVAVLVAKEKQVVEAFRRARATAPETAVRLDSIGVSERAAFRRLRDRAVIRATGAGTYYLDEPSWTAVQATRRRLGLTLLAIVLLVAAGFLLVPR